MQTLEQFDLSVLPKQAQTELYDFYLFLKQRYSEKQPTTVLSKKNTQDEQEHQAWEDIFNYSETLNIKIDPNINIRELIDQTHDVDI